MSPLAIIYPLSVLLMGASWVCMRTRIPLIYGPDFNFPLARKLNKVVVQLGLPILVVNLAGIALTAVYFSSLKLHWVSGPAVILILLWGILTFPLASMGTRGSGKLELDCLEIMIGILSHLLLSE